MSDDLFKDINNFLRNPAPEKDKLLSDSEYESVIMALARGRGDKGFTEEEAVALIEWVRLQVVTAQLVKMLLEGDLDVDTVDDKPITDGSNVGFMLSPAGVEKAARLGLSKELDN